MHPMQWANADKKASLFKAALFLILGCLRHHLSLLLCGMPLTLVGIVICTPFMRLGLIIRSGMAPILCAFIIINVLNHMVTQE